MKEVQTTQERVKKHPKILYWFWDHVTLENKQYMKDIKRIKEETPFDLLFLTARGELNFYGDKDILKPAFKEVIEYAKANDMKIGLQLWRNEEGVTRENAIALLVEGEHLLNSKGRITHTATKQGDRQSEALSCELFSAHVFDKIGSGTYEPGTLEDVTNKCEVEIVSDATLNVTLDLGEEYAGKTVYFLTAHYCQSPDLFSEFYIDKFQEILGYYDDIEFEGVGLDEFKSMNITYDVLMFQTGKKFRERLYGDSFAELFLEKTNIPLSQAVLEMRYIAKGEEYKRMRAINYYFDVFKDNVIRIENFVEKTAKELYGEDIFIGLHNTYHNTIGKDEVWQTGCMWWDLPRKYGQTDEHISYPVRLGMAASYEENIIYDMYYEHKEAGFVYQKALLDARYHTRIHYHAYHDTRPHRFNMNNDEFLANISRIEDKISLLDNMDSAFPKTDLLIVFGRPSLVNWYPKEQFRDPYDINLESRVVEKGEILWENNVVSAIVPSTKIDSGVLTIDHAGKIDYNGYKFDKLLYIGPQYSTNKAIQFLKDCAKTNVTFIDGELTHNFDGECVKADFEEIAKDAKVFEFNVERMLREGVTQSKMSNGAVWADGTVILTNADSVLNNTKEKFEIKIGDFVYTGEYIGLIAIRADEKSGEIINLICGNASDIYCNGEKIITGNDEDIVVK